jgi:hypothetical protein
MSLPLATGPGRPAAAAIVPILAFLVPMAAYLFTLAPSLYPGDSQEFIAASHVLGVPHPPGYPHYVMLGNLAARLFPFGNIAFRVNLLSAIGGAAATSVLSLIVFLLTGRFIASLAAALLLAFSSDFWAQTGSAEVYTIEVFPFLLLIYLGMKSAPPLDDPGKDATPDRVTLHLASFIFGYATGIHYFILFAIPGGLVLLAERSGWKNIGKSFATMTFCAIAGWLLFLLLPLRALAHPAINWGETFHSGRPTPAAPEINFPGFAFFSGRVIWWYYAEASGPLGSCHSSSRGGCFSEGC